jgi:hypothetical protein
MPALLSVVKPQIISLLNAGDAGASVPADDAFDNATIEEAAFQGDEQVVVAVASTVRHFARTDLLALSADIPHGSKLPSHVGHAGDVLIKRWTSDAEYRRGTPATVTQIERYRANTGTAPMNVYGKLPHDAPNSALAGYYHVSEESFLYYTGASAKVYLVTYARTSALQSPAVYTSAVVAYALGFLFQKEGKDPQAAGFYMRQAERMLAEIRGEAKALPELEQYQKAT